MTWNFQVPFGVFFLEYSDSSDGSAGYSSISRGFEDPLESSEVVLRSHWRHDRGLKGKTICLSGVLDL